MTFSVPKPVAAYLAAEAAKDADAISRCFAEDAIVRDEGLDHRGRDAIRQWKAATDAKNNYVLVPLGVRTDENKVTVRARLTGDFPGSPVDLDHISCFPATKLLLWRFADDDWLSLFRFKR